MVIYQPINCRNLGSIVKYIGLNSSWTKNILLASERLYSSVHSKVTDVEMQFNLSAVATLSREECGHCREETLMGR